MARRRAAAVEDPHDEIIAEYRARLGRPAPPPEKWRWPPVLIGPTWQRAPDGLWALPDRTIGWDVLGWCGRWLQHSTGRPWRFTDEQARFVLWWYAIDEEGRWLFVDGVLQRLKGWGKDPLAACLCAVEAFGPCRFGGWAEDGSPVAVDEPAAWVQTAAVAQQQTKNTTRLFPSLFTREAIEQYRIQVGVLQVHGLGDSRLIEAVTSSPTVLEGARATAVLRNETQHWTASNAGHGMADVIERNGAKSDGGGARSLAITNAYEPGGDSAAERDRDAWEDVQAGKAVDTGLLYDSVEAHPDAPLSAEHAAEVVESIRGDSVWLDLDRIRKSILDRRNAPSRSRRFWYNQIVAAEDAWVAPAEWDRQADPAVTPADGALVTLGFDGSKTDDDSALMGCDVETGNVFTVDVWQADGTDGWEVDRAAVDLAVRRAFDRYDVVGFYSDVHPWESYVDLWASDLGGDLCVKATPRQPVGWDMRARGKEFTGACERFLAGVVEREIAHDGDVRVRRHAHNARRRPNPWGVSIGKEHRESQKKIDAMPAAILARLARQEYVVLPEARKRKKKRSGRMWW